MLKVMNEKGIDSSKNESVKEEGREEEGTKKRKYGHIKMTARKKPRKQSDDDSDDEHRKCLKIVTFEATLDSEIMEKKYVIARLDKVLSPDGDYLVLYRANGNFRAFNYLMESKQQLGKGNIKSDDAGSFAKNNKANIVGLFAEKMSLCSERKSLLLKDG
ncbi:hypothetical protein Tco_0392431 [Tanacetum coccineum]